MDSLLVQYITAENKNGLIDQIVTAMHEPSSPYSLQDLIELLEPSLTSDDEKERNRATLLLSELFSYEKLTITSPVIHLFVIFFCRRLNDFPSFPPSLDALTTLIRNYSNDFDHKFCDLLDIIQTMTKEIHIPSYAQNLRQRSLELFELILQNKTFNKWLEAMADETIDGMLNSIEQEKDPRCLLIALRVVSLLLSSYPSSMTNKVPNDFETTLIEKLFYSISCYFPISFTPPPDDPFGITPEGLSDLLLKCLTENKDILKYSIPFFMDQINSDLESGRRDSIIALTKIIDFHSHTIFHTLPIIDEDENKLVSMDLDNEDDEDNLGEGSNHQLALYNLINILYDVIAIENNDTILSKAYLFFEKLTQSMSKQPLETVNNDFSTYYLHLFPKMKQELAGNVENMKVKALWKLCLTIGTSGGLYFYLVIINEFFEPILQRCEISARNIHQTMISSCKNIYHRLQTISIPTNDSRIFPSLYIMLDELLDCLFPNIDCSQIDALQPIQTNAYQKIFVLLMNSIEPVKITEEQLLVKNTPQKRCQSGSNGGGDCGSNHRSSGQCCSGHDHNHDHAHDNEEPSTKELDTEEKFKLDYDIIHGVNNAIQTMNSFLQHTYKYHPIDIVQINQYFQYLYHLYIHGFGYLLDFDPEQSHLKAQILKQLNLSKENRLLQSTIIKFFHDIINIEVLKDSISSVFVLPLISYTFSISENNNLDKNITKLYLQGLSSLLYNDQKKDIFALILDSLSPLVPSSDAIVSLDIHSNSPVLSQCLSMIELIMSIFSLKSSETVSFVSREVISPKALSLVSNQNNIDKESIFIKLLLITKIIYEKPFVHKDAIQIQEEIVRKTLFILRNIFLNISSDQQIQLTSIIREITQSSSTLFDYTLTLQMLIALPSTANYFNDAAYPYALSLINVSLFSSQNINLIAQSFAVCILKISDATILSQLLTQLITSLYNHKSTPKSSEFYLKLFIWTNKALLLKTSVPCTLADYQLFPFVPQASLNWQSLFLNHYLYIIDPTNKSNENDIDFKWFELSLLDINVLIAQDEIFFPEEILSLSQSQQPYGGFWQQKIFHLLLKKLQSMVQFISQSNSDGLKVYLTNIYQAICLLITNVSVNIIKIHQSSIIETFQMILSLQHLTPQSDSQFEFTILSALNILLDLHATAFGDSLHIIIPKMFEIMKNNNQARNRALALKCLEKLPSRLSYTKLFPYRQTILKGLIPVLDDRKQAVRQIAAKVRSQWCLLEVMES